jgi:hypothetical protein
MDIAKRLLKEFWFPFLLATIWTVYSLATLDRPWGFKTGVNVFGPSFFLVSWATGQFFRINKQARVERDLTSIESRVESLVTRLERHAEDFIGHATGADSVAYFMPMYTEKDILELGLSNQSKYPVFDIYCELIDLDEPIDPPNKLWTRHRFSLQSLYPNKIQMGAYRIKLQGRNRLRLNIFIQTRSVGLTQQIRIESLADKRQWAVKTTAGDKVIELQVPEDFPGLVPGDPESVFR